MFKTLDLFEGIIIFAIIFLLKGKDTDLFKMENVYNFLFRVVDKQKKVYNYSKAFIKSSSINQIRSSGFMCL